MIKIDNNKIKGMYPVNLSYEDNGEIFYKGHGVDDYLYIYNHKKDLVTYSVNLIEEMKKGDLSVTSPLGNGDVLIAHFKYRTSMRSSLKRFIKWIKSKFNEAKRLP